MSGIVLFRKKPAINKIKKISYDTGILYLPHMHTPMLTYPAELEQSELPRQIQWNSVESDLGCTLRIDIDNGTLTFHNLTLTSQKPCQHNNK